MPAATPPPANHPPSRVKAAEPSSVYQVQLVAVRKREQAEGMWKKLRSKHPGVFAKLEPEIARADLGNKGVMYRLRAGPLDSEAAARSLCADLKRLKVDCLVVRHGG
jgi:cell division septation protein DedD